MPDERGLLQVELVYQGLEVRSEGVVVVAGRRLAGLTEPAPVVGDRPVAGLQQDRDLLVPCTPAQGVAVDQNHRRSRAGVLVVQVDGPRILLANLDVRHVASPLGWTCSVGCPALRDRA